MSSLCFCAVQETKHGNVKNNSQIFENDNITMLARFYAISFEIILEYVV